MGKYDSLPEAEARIVELVKRVRSIRGDEE